jgi:glycosyltransferase involved in cell wall biosynthesis
MSVLFLMTAPPPAIEGTDAVAQEVEALRARFGGVVVHLSVSSRPWIRVPRVLWGLQSLVSLRRLERQTDVVHVYHAELFPFPILRLLRRPIVYTIVSGLGERGLPGEAFMRRLDAVVVPRADDLTRLAGSGFGGGHLIKGGIDVGRFRVRPAPPREPFVLVSGSAPWSVDQFRSKGVDTLLETAARLPFLKLVFLWRGWHLGELRRRIAQRGLADRVEVISERVDVNEVFGRAHGAVVLAEEARLVKAHPHSLLEALACGRPVIVSDGIAMAEDVVLTGCGQVVRGIDPDDVTGAVTRLREGYTMFQASAAQVDRHGFSIDRLLEDCRGLYATVTARMPRHAGAEAPGSR